MIVRDHYKRLHASKIDNLDKMEKFLLERYSLPRLNREETGNMNRPVTSTEVETVL